MSPSAAPSTLPELEMELADVVVPPQGGYVAKQCARRAHNDHDASLDDSSRDEPSAADLKRMEEGNEFEERIGQILMSTLDPDTATFLDGDRTEKSKRAREAATVAAMEDGVEFIWNCRFPADLDASRISEADALVRIGRKPKANGKWAYAPVDVKHHKSLTGTAAPRPWRVSQMDDPRFEASVEVTAAPGIVQLSDSMQLAHYHRHLETLGFAQEGPEVWGAIIGKDETLLWRDLTEALHLHMDVTAGKKAHMSALDIYDQEFAHRVEVIRRSRARNYDSSLEPLAKPEWKSECASCPWRTVCHDELEDADHITLVPGVTAEKARPFYDAGIETRARLARLDHRTALAVDAGVKDLPSLIAAARSEADGSRPAAELLAPGRSQASQARKLTEAGISTMDDLARLDERTAALAGGRVSKLALAIDQARVGKAGKVHLKRGVTRLEVPRGDVELDVDMENDPGGLIYLWGTRLVVRQDGLRIPGSAYRPFSTFESFDDHEGEAKAFADLWAWIQCLRTLCDAAGLTFRAYCYTGAENRCMRHLVDKHAGLRGVPSSAELEDFLASPEWVDLYPVVGGDMLWPTENLSLKTVAKWARFTWRESDASGDNSVVWYHQAVSDPDEAARAEARQRILEYNEDDVKATWHVREWLWTLASTRGQGKIPNVAALDRRFGPRRKKA